MLLNRIQQAINHLRSYRERDLRLQNILLHAAIKGYPQVVASVTRELKPTVADESIARRLIEAFSRASEDELIVTTGSSADIWRGLQKGPHAGFLQLLSDKNTKALAAYLCNMSRHDVSEGLVQGAKEYRKIISSRKYRNWLAIYNADRLIALAEALGILPCENPEQGRFGSNIYSNLDKLVESIDQYLQVSIIPPDVEGGLFKLCTQRGTINNRDIFAVYTAWRVSKLLNHKDTAKVCEIGAGIGKVAYYAYLLNMKSYTIIDLPYVNVLQGYYLLKCLPQANIVLYGESKEQYDDTIEVLPYWSFEQKPSLYYDLVLNQDSFPEINKAKVLNYLNNMKRNTKKYFLSVNQEGRSIIPALDFEHNIVMELVKEAGGFQSVSRVPFWLRRGYVEEIFEIQR